MVQRKIKVEDIRHVVSKGEVIAEYPDDTPYPSRLILGWRGTRPLHVVVAYNMRDKEVIVITAYEPDPTQWEADFRRRK
jgi:hypothetical protein